MVERDALSPDAAAHPRVGPGGAFLAAALLLAATPAAVAAASLGGACDRMARELRSADVAVEALTVHAVDHMNEHHGAADPLAVPAADSSAPLLFLTPRVAHILQDVFGDSDVADAKSTATPMERVREFLVAASVNARERQSVASQPAAAGSDGADDTATDFDTAISSGPLTETFYDVDTLPRFRRQMYRNDI